ncbi:MAG: hypothetical protein IPK88_03330 [Saprospiraceae bacterium]|nr:hypothetical protein [Candidatus Defluviibacterium haderslevense]
METQTKIILILLILIPSLGESQVSWSRRNTPQKYELGDILISPEGYYFISLSQNSPVYISTDEGDNWKDIADKTQLYYSFYSGSKLLKLINGTVYYGKCNGLCKPYILINGKFNIKPGITSNFEKLYTDSNNSIYYVDEFNIYQTDSNWRADNTQNSWKTQDNRIMDAFFFQHDINYVVTDAYDKSNPSSENVRIYYLNTEKMTSTLYSKIRALVQKDQVLISKEGNICINVTYWNRNQLLYANSANPNVFKEIILDSQNLNINVQYLGSADDGTYYAITNAGVYFSDGIDFSIWKKVFYMSQNLPSLNYFSIENKYYFKDSLTAIINYGNNCGESNAYIFNKKYLQWKPINLDININNLDNLQKDVHGNLYAFSPCRNYPAREYYRISEDDGKTWELFFINGEYVRSVGINKDKAAIVLAGENLFLQNSLDKTWKFIQNPIPDSGIFSSLFFYSSNGILFFEAYYLSKDGFNKIGFYFSKDGGLNWKEFSPFHQSSTDNYNDRNILVTKDRWIAYSYLSDPTVFSEDEGKTWQLDPMFVGCDHITQMALLPDNRLLISCQAKNEFGVFVSNSNNELELLSPYFRGKLNTVNFNAPSYIFGYHDLNSLPFFSKDLGKSVLELDQGINPIISDYRYFTSSLLDANNRAYLTIQNDGLYVTDTNVFTHIKEENIKKNHANIYLQQIGKNLQISIQNEISEVNNYKYYIYNQLSQIVAQGLLNHNSTLINLEDFTSGIYFFQIVDKTNQSHILKLAYIE